MRSILIIGGTGTISSPITRRLCEDPDIRVYMLNRGRHGDLFGDRVTRITADIHDTESVRKQLPDLVYDCVIDFVCYSAEDAEERIALLAGKTRQYIFISTNVAVSHEYTLVTDETLALGNAHSRYGTNKAEAEAVFRKAGKEGFPLTVVRPSQTYADARIPLSVKPGSCWPVVSRIQRGLPVIIHGDGTGIWAGTHAEDFAEYFLPLVGNERTVGETYQIVNPEPYTWKMLYHTLGELLGKETEIVCIPTEFLMKSRQYDLTESIRGDKYHSVLFDITKIREVSGDLPFSVDMRTGLQMYLEYMEAHPEEKKEDPAFDAWCDSVIRAYRECLENFTIA